MLDYLLCKKFEKPCKSMQSIGWHVSSVPLRLKEIFLKRMQFTCKVTLRRVSRYRCYGGNSMLYIFWVCVCNLRNLPCNGLASVYHLWPVYLGQIFPHYLANARFSDWKLLNIECILIFSTTPAWDISYSKVNSVCYYYKYLNKERLTWCHLLFNFII